MTRLSCHRFRSNEVRLWLSLIAYNLGNLWRRLVLPDQQLVAEFAAAAGTGGRLVCAILLAFAGRGHLSRRLFTAACYLGTAAQNG